MKILDAPSLLVMAIIAAAAFPSCCAFPLMFARPQSSRMAPSRSLSKGALGASFDNYDGNAAQVQDAVNPAVAELKADLVRLCSARSPNKASLGEVRVLVDQLQAVAPSPPIPTLLSGSWELIYAPEDATRSSPFFWAFRKAFPDSADQIFGLTDSIPAPLREIGSAFQDIDVSGGKLVSRVKVSTLGGLASSVMTTRASIVGIEGGADLKLQIDTTKPEESTAVKTVLGPLGDFINDNAPAFPSGAALERAMPGSSQVILLTTYLDDGLRVSRNSERPNVDIFVWRRTAFATESL
jgi:PAP_fibrillin